MHLLPEKTIKVAHLLVAKHQCNGADLHRRKCTQKQFRKREPNGHLTLLRRLLVGADKVPLQCLHLYSEFSSNRSNAEGDVTMICKDEMVQKPRWITEQAGMNDVLLRRPKSTYLRDDFSFDCRKLLGTRARHGSFLKAEIQQGPMAIKRQGLQKYGQSRALVLVAFCRSTTYPGSTDRRVSVYRSTPDRKLFRMPRRSFSESPSSKTRDMFGSKRQLGSLVYGLVTAFGNKRSSHWHFSFFAINARRHDIEAPWRRRQVSIERHWLDGKRRLCRLLYVNEIDFVANTSHRVLKITP
jgi:hypothetical protein